MNNNPYYAAPAEVQQMTLIQRVCYLLCTVLLVTAAAAWFGAGYMSPGLTMPCAIGALVCVFVLSFVRAQPGLALFLLYLLSVLEGLALGPLLGMIAKGFTLGPAIITEAAALSALIVGGVGTYAWMSTKDFGYLGKGLFWALIALLVVGLISMFVPIGGTMSIVYSLAGVAIFTGFVLYDVSNIKLRYGPNDYVIATVQLYLDFLNLFMFILRILLMLTGGGGSRRN
jgi:FtsH-binding integral membrane protein